MEWAAVEDEDSDRYRGGGEEGEKVGPSSFVEGCSSILGDSPIETDEPPLTSCSSDDVVNE